MTSDPDPPIIDRTGDKPRIEIVDSKGGGKKPDKCANCDRKPVERIDDRWYCEACANLRRHNKARINLFGEARKAQMEAARANLEQGMGLLAMAGGAIASLLGDDEKPKRKKRRKKHAAH